MSQCVVGQENGKGVVMFEYMGLVDYCIEWCVVVLVVVDCMQIGWFVGCFGWLWQYVQWQVERIGQYGCVLVGIFLGGMLGKCKIRVDLDFY